MAIEAELDGLARHLSSHTDRARAVLLVPVSANADASQVARGLAKASTHQTGRPVWLYDLDFARNRQAASVQLNGEAFSGELAGSRFWNAEPVGAGRLALRRQADAPIYISRFERAAGSVRRVGFAQNADYWNKARKSCGLVLVDSPYNSAGVDVLSPDMDGVILVANARTDGRSVADAVADRVEAVGGRVLGVVLTQSQAGQ